MQLPQARHIHDLSTLTSLSRPSTSSTLSHSSSIRASASPRRHHTRQDHEHAKHHPAKDRDSVSIEMKPVSTNNDKDVVESWASHVAEQEIIQSLFQTLFVLHCVYGGLQLAVGIFALAWQGSSVQSQAAGGASTTTGFCSLLGLSLNYVAGIAGILVSLFQFFHAYKRSLIEFFLLRWSSPFRWLEQILSGLLFNVLAFSLNCSSSLMSTIFLSVYALPNGLSMNYHEKIYQKPRAFISANEQNREMKRHEKKHGLHTSSHTSSHVSTHTSSRTSSRTSPFRARHSRDTEDNSHSYLPSVFEHGFAGIESIRGALVQIILFWWFFISDGGGNTNTDLFPSSYLWIVVAIGVLEAIGHFVLILSFHYSAKRRSLSSSNKNGNDNQNRSSLDLHVCFLKWYEIASVVLRNTSLFLQILLYTILARI